MSTSETTKAATPREAELQRDLRHAYESLGQITSRLMLVNEAIEAALSSHDRVEVSERFLLVAARGLEVRRAAMFLIEGDTFSVAASRGLSDEERESLVSSQADVDACGAAADSGQPFVADRLLVTGDALEVLAADAEEEAGALEEEAGDGTAEATGEEPAGGGGAGEAEPAAEPGPAGWRGEAAEEEAPRAAQAAGAGEAEAAEAEEAEERPCFGIYLAVRIEGEAVAVIGLGERARGRPYSGDDLVFLRHLTHQFAISIQRSTLIERNEARLHETEALLRVSREITSTLDLDAVLRAVVNTAAAVVENDRAEIALLKGDRLVLRAVSGVTRVDPDLAESFQLLRPLEYLRLNPIRLQVTANDFRAHEEPPGGAVLKEYFQNQEMRSFMALPLKDDQGLLGVLCLESRQESWNIEPCEGDSLGILAAQATVAVRNAMLYSQLPLRGMAAPVARLRSRFGSLGARDRRLVAAVAVLALVVLLLPVFPERAGGPAEVRPLRLQGARSTIDGVVTQVMVRGGEDVRAGQPLAVVEDPELAGRIAQLAASVEVAQHEVAVARQAGELPAWRSGQIRLDALERTLAFERQRARGAVLAAPFGGQVLELDLQQRAGQYLGQGESFCTIAALDSVGVDLEIPEERVGQVRLGQSLSAKVMAYPGRVFRGRVIEVGLEGRPDHRGVTRFLVRASTPNPGRLLRPGMTGLGRTVVGRRSLVALALTPLVRSAQLQWW